MSTGALVVPCAAWFWIHVFPPILLFGRFSSMYRQLGSFYKSIQRVYSSREQQPATLLIVYCWWSRQRRVVSSIMRRREASQSQMHLRTWLTPAQRLPGKRNDMQKRDTCMGKRTPPAPRRQSTTSVDRGDKQTNGIKPNDMASTIKLMRRILMALRQSHSHDFPYYSREIPPWLPFVLFVARLYPFFLVLVLQGAHRFASIAPPPHHPKAESTD